MYLVWENRDLDSVVSHLSKHEGYYESGLRKTHSELKFRLYENANPKVVAIGSSRVLQIRGEYFDEAFVNMGATMQSLYDGIRVVDRLLRYENPPELILFGIDYWWFFNDKSGRLLIPNEWLDVEGSEFFMVEGQEGDGLRVASIFDMKRILSFRRHGEGGLSSYVQAFSQRNRFLGLASMFTRNGFDRFGKYHYNYRIYDPAGQDRESFLPGGGERERYRRAVAYNPEIDEKNWERFLHLIERISERGIKLITFVVPNSYWATNEIDQEGLGSFVNRVEERISSLSGTHYSYWAKFGDNCEFIDEGHPGEITMARILRDLSLRTPFLTQFLDSELLDTYIEKYNGMTTINELNWSLGQERNFNALTCEGKL